MPEASWQRPEMPYSWGSPSRAQAFWCVKEYERWRDYLTEGHRQQLYSLVWNKVAELAGLDFLEVGPQGLEEIDG